MPSTVTPTDVRPCAPRLGMSDAVWILCVLGLMAVFSYARSRGRIFWGDELAGCALMRQSLPLMLHNWRMSLDSGSLFYEVFGRWWLQVFSFSEMSLRAFSAAGMAASFVILWITARRFFSAGIVGACLPLAYFLNEFVRWQFYNGRMYGGFMAACALVVYAFVRTAPDQALTRGTLLLTFCAHLFLMSSHVLGPLYSGVFIAGLVAQDLSVRQFRPRLYLSALAGWTILAVTFENIKNTTALSRFGYFTQRPRLHDLPIGAVVYSRLMFYLLAALFAGAVLAWLSNRNRPEKNAGYARRPLYFVLLCFAGILLVSFSVSLVTTSIFYNRYLLPICLGDALLMCELLQRTTERLPRTAAISYAGVGVAVAIFLVTYVREFPRAFDIPERDFTGELLQRTPTGLPVVFTDVGYFAETEFYRHDARVMTTPLDWSLLTGADADRSIGTALVQLDRWKRGGVFADRILSTPDILQRFPRFVVISSEGHTLWLRRYVQQDARYEVVPAGTYRDDSIWLVSPRETGSTGDATMGAQR